MAKKLAPEEKLIREKKINSYRNKFENGNLTMTEISKLCHYSYKYIMECVRANKWNVDRAKSNRELKKRNIYHKMVCNELGEYYTAYMNFELTIPEIVSKVSYGRETVEAFIKNNWKRRENTLKHCCKIMEKYRANYERGNISLNYIVKQTGYRPAFVSDYAKKNNWKKIKVDTKKHKKSSLILPKNIKEGEPVFYNGKYYTFIDMVNNKPHLKGYGGVGYCNSKRAIIEYERASVSENLDK